MATDATAWLHQHVACSVGLGQEVDDGGFPKSAEVANTLGARGKIDAQTIQSPRYLSIHTGISLAGSEYRPAAGLSWLCALVGRGTRHLAAQARQIP